MIGSRQQLHIAIVGTGSGAFAAAIQATERGARVTMIESSDIIGGTCVNMGCVPSKIMIRGAGVAHQQAHHHFEGVSHHQARIDRKAMVKQQQEWVEKLRLAKYENILQSNADINLVRGLARFQDAATLIVTKNDSTEKIIKADRYLLAVGARPSIADIPGLSATPYWTSADALVAEKLPKRLLVLGGSVVALELAQAFSHLGSEVTLMARSALLSKEDADIGKALQAILENEGIKIILNSVPDSVRYVDDQFIISSGHADKHYDQLLVATGRQTNGDTLSLANAGVDTDARGRIIIDDYMRTNVEHVFAVGDCTTQPQYVYVAAAAGTRAAKNMTGDNVALDLSVLPSVVFTEPAVASVGLSEQQAIASGLQVDSRKLGLENIPRAIANMDTRGFIKLVAEKSTGRIVGCQVLAAEAGEIIQTAAIAIRNHMTIQEMAEQLFPYLTMVEGLKLCAQTFNKDVTQLSCCAG